MTAPDRFSHRHPCPICCGHPGLRAGQGERCAGFLSGDGSRALCTREELAGQLDRDERTTPAGYWHRLNGACRCGGTHGGGARYAAHRANGLTRRTASGPVVRYRICALDGTVVAVHCRQDYTDGTKRVWWERPDGSGGLNHQPARNLHLYGTERLAGLAAETIAIVCEGEKDTDAVNGLGLPGIVAVGTVTGAPAVPDSASWEPLSKFGRVALWPDADEPGERQMAGAAAVLAKLGQTALLRLSDPATVSGSGDGAADFVSRGGNAAGLRALLDAAKPWPAPEGMAESSAANSGAPSQAQALIELARAEFRFGRTDEGQAFAVPLVGPNLARVLRGGSHSLRAELARRRFEIAGRVPNQSALTDALMVLEGQASVAEPEALPLRVARHEAGSVLDLGRADGQCVVVTPKCWSVESRSPVTFERTALTQQLPVPIRGGSLDALWPLLNVSEDDRPLVLAWEVTALLPDLPCPILFLRGFQGTAKTETARALTWLIDPSPSAVAGKPADPEQWALTARAMRTFTLDNLSSVPEWLSDALCRAVTGDAYVRRSLYENREVQALSFQRAMILTAIDAGALHGDLAERVVGVELEQITPDRRRLLTEVRSGFRAEHPQMLGALLDLLVKVLAERENVPADRLARMADFDLVLRAVDNVCKSEGRARYAGQSADLAREVLEGDAVAQAILTGPNALEPGEVATGTATELLRRFTPNPAPPKFPPTPHHFTGRLRRLAPSLQAVGVTFASGREGKDRIRQVTLTRGSLGTHIETPHKSASAASAASIRSQDQDADRLGTDASLAQADAQWAASAGADAQSARRTLADAQADAHSPRWTRSQADAADAHSLLFTTEEEEVGSRLDGIAPASAPPLPRHPGLPLPDDGQPCPACGSTARRVAPTQRGQATFCAACNPGPAAGKQP